MDYEIKLTIKEKDLKGIKDDLMFWASVELENSQLLDLLNNDKYLAAEIAEWGLDTSARDKLMNLLSKSVCGMKWPCGVDGKEYAAKWEEKFKAGAKEKNIKLLNDNGQWD